MQKNSAVRRIAIALTAWAFAIGLVTLGTNPAQAATTYTQISLAATVSGTSVTATTTVKASTQTTATYYGVCVRDSAGNNLDYPRTSNALITTTGTVWSGTKTFAPGTYTYFPCLYVGTTWYQPGSSKTFTVAAPSSGPSGPNGTWNKVFYDEFDGTGLDTTKWNPAYQNTQGGSNSTSTPDSGDKKMNGVFIQPSNVSVSGGIATLKLSNVTNGAMIMSGSADSAPAVPGGWKLPVGGAVEFRVKLPVSSTGSCPNWAAAWTSGLNWPYNGEIDVVEILDAVDAKGGRATSNYHRGQSWDTDVPSPIYQSALSAPSAWCGTWHTYTAVRGQSTVSVYWDGVLKGSIARNEPGNDGQALILNIGELGTRTDITKTLQVDYVRGFTPA